MKKNCATHGHPDCFEPFCVILEQVELIVDERDLLRAEVDTATEEPLIVLKALKTAEAQREELKKQVGDTAREYALVDAEARKLREENKRLEALLTDFVHDEENADSQIHDVVDALEDAKGALVDVAGGERTMVAIDNDHAFWVKVNDALDAYYKWFKKRKRKEDPKASTGTSAKPTIQPCPVCKRPLTWDHCICS